MLRKLFVSTVCLVCGMTVMAQTNFREITFQQALDAAKAESKLVFIDVMTSWCGPCKMMAREVFPQQKVGEYMNSHFVCMKIDAEKGEGIGIAKTYGVSAYPTFLIIDTNKKEVARSVGMKQADAFVAELERIVNPDAAPEKLKMRYESGERTPSLVKMYAGMLTNAANESRRDREQKLAEVNAMVQDYYADLTQAQRFDPENLFVYANYTNSVDSESGKFLTQNANKFPAESKDEINSIIQKLFLTEEYAMLCGRKTTTKESIDSFEKDVKRLALNKDGHFDNSLKLMRAYNGDGNDYLQMCRSLFKSLNPTQQTGVMESISEKFANADAETKKAASRVIREQLADMESNMLYSAMMAIMRLENKGH
ncbi:MAG: thioredoxin family protein [Prevotella sp.]|nr:thioredoxin family protein [Prevotella sp.]